MFNSRVIHGFLVSLVSVSALLLSAASDAKPPEDKGKPHKAATSNSERIDETRARGNSGRSHGRERHGDYDKHVRDDVHDLVRAAIGFDQVRRVAVDHGYTGYSELPPGIRKNLARGKPLPPGIAKKAVPPGLLGQLPHYPGYEWQVAGSDLVLISAASAIIADVLYDVFD